MKVEPPIDGQRNQGEAVNIALSDAQMTLFPNAFPGRDTGCYLEALQRETPWRQDQITVHGRTVPLPRLQAWYADDGKELRYSGMRIPANTWTATLTRIRARVSELCSHNFNAVLVNYYRDGNDSVGWHSDDEPEWGPDPIIASVSFGARRDFVLRHRYDASLATVSCPLPHGSVLLMGRGVQTHWRHQLPKRRRVYTPRINLTFRNRPG